MDWPLIGREAEIATVVADLGAGRSVVVTGDAGVGANRVAEAAAVAFAERTRTRPLRVVGSAVQEVPLAALSGLLRGRHIQNPVGDVAAALTDQGIEMIHIEDVHHLDDVSATVLHQLIEQDQIQSIATRRTGSPVSQAVARLLGSERFTHHHLQHLGRGATQRVLEAALDGPLDGRTVQQYFDFTGGNSFALRTLVEADLAGGRLSQRAGLWRLTGERTVPIKLGELVAQRLGSLSATEREALELLAVAGQLSVTLALDAADPAAVEALERSGLLVAQRRGGSPAEIRLAHPIYAEHLLASMPATTRWRLSRRLAEVSQTASQSTVDEIRAVVWHLDGELPVDPTRALNAARSASALGDTATAARLATAAFDADSSATAAPLASWCLSEIGKPAEGVALLERAVLRSNTERDSAMLLICLATETWWQSHLPKDATAYLDAAESLGPLGCDFAAAQRAVFSALDGQMASAAQDAGVLEFHDDPWVASSAAIALALADVLGGHPERGAERALSAYERAATAPVDDLGSGPGVHLVTRVYNLIASGRMAEADELAGLVYDVAVTQPGRQARAWAAMIRGEVALDQGNLLAARQWFIEAEVAWADCGIDGLARWSAIGAALGAALAADQPNLANDVRRAEQYDGTGFAMLDIRLGRARLWSHALAGGGSVDEQATDIATQAIDHGAWQLAAEVAWDLLRLGRATAAAELIGGLALEGARNEAMSAVINGAAGSDPDSMAASVDRLAAMGCLLDAADAAEITAGLYRSMTNARRAERMKTIASSLRARCPGAQPGAAARGPSSGLSKREQQVAELAAAGMTNRAISAKLVVSERTVENHLYRCFIKLGVTSREALPGALAGR